jgi:hypothetical protein
VAAGRKPIGRIKLADRETKEKRSAFAIWDGNGKGHGVSADNDKNVKPGSKIAGFYTEDGEQIPLAKVWVNLYMDDPSTQREPIEYANKLPSRASAPTPSDDDIGW